MERCVDIEALAAKIEKEINDLERKVDRVDSNKALAPFEYTPVEITKIINNIDRKLEELDRKYSFPDIELDVEDEIRKINERLDQMELDMYDDFTLDLEDLSNKVNARLSEEDDDETEEELDKTIYDLSEISKVIDDTIKKLERQKEKKGKI